MSTVRSRPDAEDGAPGATLARGGSMNQAELRQIASAPLVGPSSITEVVRARAALTPTCTALVFLEDGENRAEHWTYAKLWEEATRVAGVLASLDVRGQPVLLQFEPGLEFVATFLGIMAAGCIAVPLTPWAAGRNADRIEGILADSQARLILTSRRLYDSAPAGLRQREGVVLLCAGNHGSTASQPSLPDPRSNDVAMLQYTSGSTGQPKGVVLTHDNIIANCNNVYEWLGPDPDRRGCIWLPPHHDMGLLGGILQPLFAGYPLICMSPLHFMQLPMRWLRAISKYRVTLSGAPNFAYELCQRSIDPEQLAGLDLSSWRQAFCGSEIVSARTLEGLAAHLEVTGFRLDAFVPCYGLAEATLLVSGRRTGGRLSRRILSRAQLEQGRAADAVGEEAARTVVGCGVAPTAVDVKVVATGTLRPCAPGEVGEIWVAGRSVSPGYYRNGRLTDEVFHNELPGSAANYLRTGDLGVQLDGELFITGRLKELIVVAGRNLHAEDIEASVEGAHPLFRAGSVAAFSMLEGEGEQLVVVAEVHGSSAKDELADARMALLSSLAKQHGVRPDRSILCRRGRLPRTTSGKVRRSETRSMVERGLIESLAEAEA